MAEFANISPHYTFCVHHKPYTALLDTSFLDFMQLFFPVCSRLLTTGSCLGTKGVASFTGCQASSELGFAFLSQIHHF
jgi:hypothetical protein